MSDEFAKWLGEQGLGQYADVFAENAIAFRALPALTEEDLKELGLKLGHRRLLQQAIAGLSERGGPLSDPVAAIASSPDADTNVAAWERHPGERKPVTMLFADVTGSTALTETLDAEETHDLLYGATQRMCEAVENNRGTVCRFMGDGVMAMFGAPIASESHAVSACEAAMAMQQAVSDYAAEVQSNRDDGLRIRVGLHSGEVVVLTVGEGEKVEYDASGPTVPIAARMEQVAEPGEIYLTAATQSLAGDRIEARELDPITVKGISSPVSAFTLERVKTAEELAGRSFRTVFVGRKAQLAQFTSLLDACLESGFGQTLLLRGEPGIGKTRLVEEFGRLAGTREVSTHRGLVLPFGVGKGQDVIRALMRSLLGVAFGTGKEGRQRAARAAMERELLEPDQWVYLNDLLNLEQPTELRALYDAMDNSSRNRRKQAVVAELITGMSRKRAILIVVEDLHWAESITLAHLANLAMTVARCPALLVMSSRVDGDPLDHVWRGSIEGAPFLTIDLGPLRSDESLELISEFIDSSDPLAASCLERAAGNPLFLEQLLQSAAEGSGDHLPDSIQSLIQARLDRLTATDKQALQAASVIGQRFRLDELRHLARSPGYECTQLLAHDLVHEESGDYLFAHALIQEGVYASLLKNQRRGLHRAAAEWFAESDPVLHAEHLERADDPDAAAAYLQAAGAQKTSYRYQRALKLVDRGLSVAARPVDQARLRCLKGEVLRELGSIQESIREYRSVMNLSVDDELRCAAHVGVAAGMRVLDGYDEAFEALDKAEALAEPRALSSELTRIHYLRGSVCFPLARIEESLRHQQLALDYARKAGSLESEALALSGLGDAEYARGRLLTANEHFRDCVTLSRAHGFGRIEVANLPMLAWMHRYLGEPEAALEGGLEALKAAQRVGNPRAELVAMVVQYVPLFETGDMRGAEAWITRTRELVRTLGARRFDGQCLSCLAKIRWIEGSPEEAERLAAEAVAVTRETGIGFSGPRALGALALVTCDETTRRNAMEEAEALLERGAVAHNHFDFYTDAIQVALYAEDWDGAHRYADRLTEFTRAEPLPWVTFFVDRGRALAEFGRGKRDDATIRELRRVRDAAENMRLNVAIPELEEALSST